MIFFIIAIAAFFTSSLTFFSGFGLGTLLMPVLLIFFPIEMAIALTAVVHFFNNLLKLILLWRRASWDIVLRFGVPALLAAFLGAQFLFLLERFPAFAEYSFFGKEAVITPVKLIIALLMIFFVILEMAPQFKHASLPARFLPWGGLLSGFLGGLSGHQGALRSMFLLKCGLNKEAFLATGIVIACLVDFSRLSVYSQHMASGHFLQNAPILFVAVVSAFAGVFLGNIWLKKVTLEIIHIIVAVLLILISLLLGAGLI